jgi:hypothetical protein
MWTSVSPWIQASEGEIRQALEEGPAFELDGRWRGIDPGYLAGAYTRPLIDLT